MESASPKDKKSVNRLAKSLIHSVVTGVYNEKIKSEVETYSLSEASQLVEILKNHAPLLQLSQTSTPVLFSYWTLLLRLFGRDMIKCSAWDTFILQRIGSVNLEVTSSLFPLLKDIVRVDNEIAQKLFESYFRSQRLPLAEKVLSYFSTQKPKIFFQALGRFLKNKQHTLSSLRLLTNVTSNQGAHVDVIVETKCMNALVKILQETTDLTILGMGIMNITMVLPVIPSRVPDLLPEFFKILTNVLSFPTLPPQIKKQLIWFLQHIYGMFPLHFSKLLRDLYRSNTVLVHKLEPVLSHLRFSFGLLTTMDEELDVNRWKNREPHQIVIECVQDDYVEQLGKFQMTESIEELYNQITMEEPQVLDLGALSEEGKKILQLQDLIEEKILLQPKTEYEQIFATDQLESRFILLRNELLFERYLQKQYLRRLRKVKANTMAESVVENPGIRKEDYEVIKLKNTEQNAKIKQLERNHKQWEENVTQKAAETLQNYKKLEQQHADLQIQYDTAQEDIENLTEELQEKSFRVSELEIELTAVKEELNNYYEPYKACANNISKNISLWEQNYQRACDNAKTATEIRELLEEKEDTISLLQAKIDADMQKMSVLSEQIRESKHTIAEMNATHKKQQEDILHLRSVLAKQGDVTSRKIQAIEQKYQTIRKINIALERRCGQLYETLEMTNKERNRK